MNNNNKQRLIDKYFDNTLTKKEHRLFDELVENDTEFKSDVEFEENIRKVIGEGDVLDFRKKVHDTVKSKHRKSVVQSYIGTYWKYAATIALIVGIGVSTVWIVNDNNSNEKLFEKAYSTSKISATRAPLSSASSIIIAEAMLNYHEGNYYNAIGYFEELLKKNESNIAVRFYLGISYMETENFDKATDSFRYIISDQDNLYIEHAEWYLGLCFLKENEIDKAVNQFTIIAQNENNYYSAQATKMLKKMNRDY